MDDPSSPLEGSTATAPTARPPPPAASEARQCSDDSFGPDSWILHDLLAPGPAAAAFERLLSETAWQTATQLSNALPRLVCVQACIGRDGSVPVYRHPCDATLPTLRWTDTVAAVREAAEQVAGHSLNHALVQLYRGGRDAISEHSDKTLDMVPGSRIVNVSLGAQRALRLRRKRAGRAPAREHDGRLAHAGALDQEEGRRRASSAGPAGSPPLLAQPERVRASSARDTIRVPLRHNSAVVLGPRTNSCYLHSIQPDKRARSLVSTAESAYGGLRISLTFRSIGTFAAASGRRIWGLGATGRTLAAARATVTGEEDDEEGGGGGGGGERERLFHAFSVENRVAGIDRAAAYGGGSDVLLPPAGPRCGSRDGALLFLAGDEAQDRPVLEAVAALAAHKRPAVAVVAAADLGLAAAACRAGLDAPGAAGTGAGDGDGDGDGDCDCEPDGAWHDCAGRAMLPPRIARAVMLRGSDTLRTEVRGVTAVCRAPGEL